MPDNVTHRRVGPAAAAAVCWMAAIPWWAWPVILWLAERSSPWPDEMERPFRRWRRFVLGRPVIGVLERPLRYLQRHRWWTHGIPVEVLIAMLAGAVVIGVGIGLGAIGVAIVNANSAARVVLPEVVKVIVAWAGIFAALGLAIGMAAHSLLDTGTEWGSPIAYPFSKKRVHLLPKKWWIGDDDEVALCRWSPVFVVAMAYLSFAPSWWLPYVWHYLIAALR